MKIRFLILIIFLFLFFSFLFRFKIFKIGSIEKKAIESSHSIQLEKPPFLKGRK